MPIYNPDNPNYNVGYEQGAPPGVEGVPYPANPATPVTSGGGGFNLGNIGQGVTDFLNGGGNSPITNNAYRLAAAAAAYKQWQDANKYMDTARQAAQISNPFGDERAGYISRMRQLYDDPTAYLNQPAYQRQLQHGLDSVARTGASQGYLGSGNMTADLMDYAHLHDQEYIDAEKARLAPLTGYQFDPANAGRMLMTGQDQQIRSQNGALASLGQILGTTQSGTTINNNGSPGNGAGGPSVRLPGGGSIPVSTIIQGIQASGMNGATAAQLIGRILSSPNGIDASTLQILRDSGINLGDGTLPPTGVDVAPPGYYGPGGGGYVEDGFGGTPPISNGFNTGGFDTGINFPSPENPIDLGSLDFENFDPFGIGGW